MDIIFCIQFCYNIFDLLKLSCYICLIYNHVQGVANKVPRRKSGKRLYMAEDCHCPVELYLLRVALLQDALYYQCCRPQLNQSLMRLIDCTNPLSST